MGRGDPEAGTDGDGRPGPVDEGLFVVTSRFKHFLLLLIGENPAWPELTLRIGNACGQGPKVLSRVVYVVTPPARRRMSAVMHARAVWRHSTPRGEARGPEFPVVT